MPWSPLRVPPTRDFPTIRRSLLFYKVFAYATGTFLLLVCAGLIAGSWGWASGRYSAVADVRNQKVSVATAALRDQFQFGRESPLHRLEPGRC